VRQPDDDAPGAGPTRTSSLRLLFGVYRKADAAYAAHSCPGTAECCRLAMTQREPWLWEPEWWALEDALKKEGRALPLPRSDGACPFLDSAGARCTVYASRPLGCRTFFCEKRIGPAREPLEEMDALLRQVEELTVRADPDARGPRPLREWYQAAREAGG